MYSDGRKTLIKRIRRGKVIREQLVSSHLSKGIAFQIRAIRDRLGWSQEKLAAEVGMNQNAVSRLESPEYGRPTLTTLKRFAAAFDVGLVVRFVPFSEIVDWVNGTPRIVRGISNESLSVPSFNDEEAGGVFDEDSVWPKQREEYEQTSVGGNQYIPHPPENGRVAVASGTGALYVVPKPIQQAQFVTRQLTGSHETRGYHDGVRALQR